METPKKRRTEDAYYSAVEKKEYAENEVQLAKSKLDEAERWLKEKVDELEKANEQFFLQKLIHSNDIEFLPEIKFRWLSDDQVKQIRETKYILTNIYLNGITSKQRWDKDLDDVYENAPIVYGLDDEGYTLNFENSGISEFHYYSLDNFDIKNFEKHVETIITSKMDQICATFGDMEDAYEEYDSEVTEGDWDSPIYMKCKYIVEFSAFIPKSLLPESLILQYMNKAS